MPDFEKLLMFGVKKPGISARDMRILSRRKDIARELERSRLRLASIGAILELGDMADAALLANSLRRDIVKAAGHIHNIPALLAEFPEGEDLERLPDQELRQAVAALDHALAVRTFSRHAALAALQSAQRAYDLLDRSFGAMLENALAAPLDGYEKRRSRRLYLLLAVVFVLVAGTILSWEHIAAKRREQAVEFLERDKEAQAQESLQALAALAYQAKRNRLSPLPAITGDVCTQCGCEDRNLQSLDKGDKCSRKWLASLEAILEAAGNREDAALYLADPWGAPYLLNENEKEQPGECVKDTITSAGRDGRMGTPDDLTATIDNLFCKN